MTMQSVPKIFDRGLYAARRARAGLSDAEHFLAAEAASALADRLAAVRRHFDHALELSSRRESAARLAPYARAWTRTSLGGGGDVVADEEALPFAPERFDLVVSVLSLHAVNDLPGALAQIRRILKPDGLFLAALFGGDTLSELRAAFAEGELAVRGGISPRVAPFADVRALGALLQRAGFALPVADCERTVAHYRAFTTLTDDLRALGETNALAERERRPLRRDVLDAVIREYVARHADDAGRLTATFEIVYLTGWAPHDSQPKPLRPGSASARLAEALGTIERKTGDRPAP